MATDSANLHAVQRLAHLDAMVARANQMSGASEIWGIVAELARVCRDQEQRLLVLGPCCGDGEPYDHRWDERGYGRRCVICGVEK